MVKSGLAVRTDVSHIRLAVHLITALVTLGGIVWTALDLYALHRDRFAAPARLTAIGAMALVLLLSGPAIGGAMRAYADDLLGRIVAAGGMP